MPCRVYFPLSVSPCLLPWVVLFCVVNLVFLPAMAFCFLSHVHMAHIQIAPGWARPPVCWTGQPALQAGLRRQDQQSAAGSGGAHQAAVKKARLWWPGRSWEVLMLDSQGVGGRGQSPAPAISILSLPCPFSRTRIQKASCTPTFPTPCQHLLLPKKQEIRTQDPR